MKALREWVFGRETTAPSWGEFFNALNQHNNGLAFKLAMGRAVDELAGHNPPLQQAHMLTDKDQLLSLAQLAKRWDVHTETVRARRKNGLRGIKFGRRLMFRLSDIRAYETARLDKEAAK
jgi:hypothetical protein